MQIDAFPSPTRNVIDHTAFANCTYRKSSYSIQKVIMTEICITNDILPSASLPSFYLILHQTSYKLNKNVFNN